MSLCGANWNTYCYPILIGTIVNDAKKVQSNVSEMLSRSFLQPILCF